MKAETGLRLFGVLRAAYPARPLDDATGALYMALLADLPDAEAEAAVLALCRTQTFFPAAAEILAWVVAHRDPLPTAGEAWEQVLGAIRRGDHRRDRHDRALTVAALEGVTAAALEGIGGLQAVAETTEIETTRAHFFHRFAELAAARRRASAELGGPTSLAALEDRLRTALPAGALVAHPLLSKQLRGGRK